MLRIRKTEDFVELMSWRREVLENVFGLEPDEDLMEANLDYYDRNIRDGSHVAFIAEFDGRECGCGAVCFSEELPSPDNPNGKCAYLMNIYVRSPYRCHGIAHEIVKILLKEAQNRKCGKIYLETTDEGRPVYTSLGFRDLPDMMKYYE